MEFEVKYRHMETGEICTQNIEAPTQLDAVKNLYRLMGDFRALLAVREVTKRDSSRDWL